MPFGRPGDGLRYSFHDLTIAHLKHELARTILCCTCNKQLSRWRRGSWKGSIAGWARQLNRNVTRFGNDKFFDLDGNHVGRELSQDHLRDVRRQPLNQLPAPALVKLEQAPRHGV